MKNRYVVTATRWWLAMVFLLSIVLCAQGQTAQPPVVQWQRVVEGDGKAGPVGGRPDILKNSQGGYFVLTADKRLLSLTSSGDIVADTPITGVFYDRKTTPSLNVTGLAPTSDGGVVVGVQDNLAWALQKRNADGSVAWVTRFLPSNSYFINDVVASPDGGFVAFATYQDQTTPSAPANVIVNKVDKDGIQVWYRELKYPSASGTFVQQAIATSDGGYLLAGSTYAPSDNNTNFRGWTAKLDAQGNTTWQKRYDQINGLNDVAPYNDSDLAYVINGPTFVNNSGSGLYAPSSFVINTTGDLVSTVPVGQLPFAAFNSSASIVAVPSTNRPSVYAVVNDTPTNTNGGDIRLTSFSAQGAVVWTKTLGGSGHDYGFKPAVVATDNGFVVVGITESTDGDVKGRQTNRPATWIVKLEDPAKVLTLIQPAYNCQTGAITFNISGGDGSPITYNAPGISRASATSSAGTVEQGLRNDPKPIAITATQSGQTVSYTFDLASYCGNSVSKHPDIDPLTDLYNATNGPGWTNKTNWLTGNNPCNWWGVTCNTNGRVEKLQLDGNKLDGILPTSLGNLSQLSSLYLVNNQLSGPIPASLGSLKLLNLFLHTNRLSGSIPASLGNLTELLNLSLSFNQLSGTIPASLNNLTKLTFIDLGNNQLTGSIPENWGNFPNLVGLLLSNNQLSGSIPASIGTMTALRMLYLNNNQLSGCFSSALSALCSKDVRLSGNADLPGGGDFSSFCTNGTGSCTPPPPPTNTGVTLILIQPTYNCSTGAITFNTSGGDGSPITYNAPGISRTSATSNTGIVEQGLRNDPKPIMITATQNGNTVSYPFDFGAFCTIQQGKKSPVFSNIPDRTFRSGQFVDGEVDLRGFIIGSGYYDASDPHNYLTWSITASGLPPGLRIGSSVISKTFFYVAISGIPTTVGTYPVTVTVTNPQFPNSSSVSRFTITIVDQPVVNPSPDNALTLLAPSYDCATGAIVFRTSGGTGSGTPAAPIEYAAAGITGWTTNPNQFVDKDSRTAGDVQPFTLMARQNGVMVTYVWDLKAACGRARLGTAEAEAGLRIAVLGNPVSDVVTVEIRGAAGQPLTLRLVDRSGRLLEQRVVGQPEQNERQVFELQRSGPGLLLLRASSGTQSQTVKILRQ